VKINKNYLIVLVVLIISGIMIKPNLMPIKGGILDDNLTWEEDKYRQANKEVEELAGDELAVSGQVLIPVKPFSSFNYDFLVFIKRLTEVLAEKFPDCKVVSLANKTKYRVIDDTEIISTYINDEVLSQAEQQGENWDFSAWLKEVKEDKIASLLINETPDYFNISILLPKGYDEILLRTRVAEFLENRQIPWYYWFYKTDIYPDPVHFQEVPVAGTVALGGWPIARGLMDAGLVASVLILAALGLIATASTAYLSLRSIRQALIVVIVIGLACFWVRGSIGLSEMLDIKVFGVHLAERVYILLVFTAIIVSGISFTTRRLEFYNAQRKRYSREEAWKRSATINSKMYIVAFIAIPDFLLLYQIWVRGLLEVGILAALGNIYLVILVKWFVPAIQSIIGGEVQAEKELPRLLKWPVKLWHKALDKGINGCYFLLTYFQPAKTAVVSIVVLALVSAAAVSYYGRIPVITRPLEYIKETIAYTSAKWLNANGAPGFGRVPILIVPQKGYFTDIEFFKRAYSFQKAIERYPEVRRSYSIMDEIIFITAQDYGVDFPKNSEIVKDAIYDIENREGELLKRQFWFSQGREGRGGLVVFTTVPAETSVEMAQFGEYIFEQAENEFADLKIKPFGKFMTFQRSDKYIAENGSVNIFNCLPVIWLVGFFWIWQVNRRHQASDLILSPWRTGLVMSTPFCFASAIIVLVMYIKDISIDQAAVCITPLAVNAAIDFNVHLVSDYHETLLRGCSPAEAIKYAILKRGKINLIDVLLNAICFLPLCFSLFEPVRRLGWMMATMLIFCGIGALLIMPALLPLCVVRRKVKYSSVALPSEA